MGYITSYKPETGFDTPERCHIIELSNSEKDPACSIAKATVKPGVTTQLHNLSGIIERYVILAGEGNVEINGTQPAIVKKFDVVIIPADVSQKITNTGTTDLEFLCICTPRFKEKAYASMEQG